MAAPIESELLTAQEAMAVLKCKRSYLTMHADEIGVVRRGGRLFFYRADLDAWNLRHYRRPAGAPEPMRRTRPAVVARGSGRINPVTRRPYGTVLP
jgi:hypothetical protein